MQCPPKTSSSRRTVVLDRTTVKELRRHYARQQTEAARMRIDPSGFVFTNRRGQPLNPDHLYREFIRATKDAGLPPIRLHDLRHGAASLALQSGASLKVIQDQLGHASIVLTADTYVSVEPDLHVARQKPPHTSPSKPLDASPAPGVPGIERLQPRIRAEPEKPRTGPTPKTPGQRR